jgi:hypothetical protein
MSEEAGEYKGRIKCEQPEDLIVNNLRKFVRVGQQAQAAVDLVTLVSQTRTCLHRWRSRYAASSHAKQHVHETNLLIEKIDEWLLKH